MAQVPDDPSRRPAVPHRAAALDGFREESIATAVDVWRPDREAVDGAVHSLGASALLDAPGRGRHASLDWAAVRERLKAAGLLDARGSR